MYYTYILRCSGGTLYTGITTDVSRRMSEHFSKSPEGAKYTKSHSAERLEAVWESGTRSLASKLEYRIKHNDMCRLLTWITRVLNYDILLNVTIGVHSIIHIRCCVVCSRILLIF